MDSAGKLKAASVSGLNCYSQHLALKPRVEELLCCHTVAIAVIIYPSHTYDCHP